MANTSCNLWGIVLLWFFNFVILAALVYILFCRCKKDNKDCGCEKDDNCNKKHEKNCDLTALEAKIEVLERLLSQPAPTPPAPINNVTSSSSSSSSSDDGDDCLEKYGDDLIQGKIWTRVAQQAEASTVTILVSDNGTDFEQSGSGFKMSFGDAGVYLVTAQHVVAGANFVQAVDHISGLTFDVDVLIAVPVCDFALLLPSDSFGQEIFDNMPSLEETKVKISEDLEGREVMAVGSPFGLFHTKTTGTISQVYFNLLFCSWIIEHGANTNPGNSGGPLIILELDEETCTLTPRVVGINVAFYAVDDDGGPFFDTNIEIAQNTFDIIRGFITLIKQLVGLQVTSLKNTYTEAYPNFVWTSMKKPSADSDLVRVLVGYKKINTSYYFDNADTLRDFTNGISQGDFGFKPLFQDVAYGDVKKILNSQEKVSDELKTKADGLAIYKLSNKDGKKTVERVGVKLNFNPISTCKQLLKKPNA